MMLAHIDSQMIPSGPFIQEDCAWCWYAEHPHTPFPEHWSSTICAFHEDWQLARLAARRAHKAVVNFVLIESEPEPEPLYFPYTPHVNRPCYPANWSKASYVLRRSLGFRCEQCKSSVGVAVHHIGLGYPTGRRGDAHDKHDLRRENLICLCHACHEQADQAQGCKRRKCKV